MAAARSVRNDLRTTHIDPLIRVHEPEPQLLISAPRLSEADVASLKENFQRLYTGGRPHWEPAVKADTPPRKPHRRKHTA